MHETIVADGVEDNDDGPTPGLVWPRFIHVLSG